MNISKINKKFKKLFEKKQSIEIQKEKNEILKSEVLRKKTIFEKIAKNVIEENNNNKLKVINETSTEFNSLYTTLKESFVSNENIIKNTGFLIDNNNGIISLTPSSITSLYYKVEYDGNNRKKITFVLDVPTIINELVFNFYKAGSNETINLNKVKISGAGEDDSAINLQESFLRYYDNNYKIDNFNKKILFTPKKVSSITFTFEEDVDSEKHNVEILQNTYEHNTQKEIVIKYKNKTENTGVFKVKKNDFNKKIKLDYKYSFDNVFFQGISFVKEYKYQVISGTEKINKTTLKETNQQNITDMQTYAFSYFFIKIQNKIPEEYFELQEFYTPIVFDISLLLLR